MTYRPLHHTIHIIGVLCVLVFIIFCVHTGTLSTIFNTVSANNISNDSLSNSGSGGNIQTMSILKASLNPDSSALLGGGDVLVLDGALVPYGDIDGKDTISESKTANGEISLYVVREGDTLSQIATMFDISAKTILWANSISNAQKIQPGDTLVILPITGIRHVVKKGDTIKTIAKKYEGDVDDILAYNQLASVTDIHEGETIVVPGGVMVQPETPKKNTSSSRAKTTKVATGNGSAGFSHPLPGSVRTQGLHGFNGIDFGASAGTPIYAAAAGEVIVAKGSGYNGGYGLYVVIKHANGTQTLYAHNSRNAVAVGDIVTAGEVIGYVGSTGRSTGNHLHFEVRGARNPF